MASRKQDPLILLYRMKHNLESFRVKLVEGRKALETLDRDTGALDAFESYRKQLDGQVDELIDLVS
jgi:hypothetical protein